MDSKPTIHVIKVGGKIVEEPQSLDALLKLFTQIPGAKVLVHGGGRSATALAARLGIETTMINGRRVTSDEMLEVVTMVYGGLVNKRIVAALQALDVNALGVTGADLNLLLSDRRPITPEGIDYGWVGDVKKANDKALCTLIMAGITPVVAPLTHDGKGNILNTNADTIAAETAKALASHFNVKLIYCFEKDGVLADPDDDNSVLPEIDPEQYASLKAQGVVAGGMIPKLDNAFDTLQAGVAEVVITKASAIHDHSRGTHLHL